ncbi:putative outer membrane starch-binding protein [Sphingobacterium allocomposti]|uniref:Putative outer membrane starch-binding protein n=1 Tax=Sphingobacterium allocomposti TaxID=415956 RepID=A0A5S5CU77_9SPHI|nr:RagB/SusD family nutrient uptake outer membrane protein [Sphingobacterium composti Yoo et al. 2007 non Ten et al. 2007]TYP87320.1 putative outer membrane starch-binding protein [Sphingobacterium composti Yoo et al. 2007 non Ten et al. 2007]
MKILKYIAIAGILSLSSCSKDFLGNDFLTKDPLDQLTDPAFWSSENNIRTYTYGFYNYYFRGYGSGFGRGTLYDGQFINDDFIPISPNEIVVDEFVINVPTSGGGWSPTLPASQTPTGTTSYYSRIRKANHFIESVPKAELAEEVQNHWLGIGRFFRGLEYASFVNAFGDVPYVDHVLTEDDPDLYRPRDPRTYVMDRVLEDFKFAAEHVRASDGPAQQAVNKYVVLAFMSRVFLFEGTWLKYHAIDEAKATEYLEAAKWAAEEVINSGAFTISNNYRGLFSSETLRGNPEVILYKEYAEGILSHSAMSYNNLEPQAGMSKNAIDSYLLSDGLPIGLSPLYENDRTVANALRDRDGRLQQIIAPQLRMMNVVSNFALSGYAVQKFLNESLRNQPVGTGSLNITDAPIIRYGEVLMNYAEAAAELGLLTQNDLDKTINVLRNRNGVGLPRLEVAGGRPAVNGTPYDDPARDPSVPSLLWEIRRERRAELIFEGHRLNDLRRWKKLEYADTERNPTNNRGAYIVKSAYSEEQLNGITIDGENEGYIIPSASIKRTVEEKLYLDPIPLDQISLYERNGVELKQNPGWE